MTQTADIPYSIAELVPQAPPFILLDKLVGADEHSLTAEVRIAEDSKFFRPFDGVPAWVGIEYMAQAIGAFAGLQERREGREPRIGFLVGARNFSTFVPYFVAGSLLRVRAEETFNDGTMGVFATEITGVTGDQLTTARLNVYLPGSHHAHLNEAL